MKRCPGAALVLLLGLLLCPSAHADEPRGPSDDGQGVESKKRRWLKDKAARRAIRARRVAEAAEPVLSLHNLWTGEVLPLRAANVDNDRWSGFLRCHHTNQRTQMDGRLLRLLRTVAARFQSSMVEIVSGFRAPKYNLMLRKKGRQVARDSQHSQGNAVDFRLPGVPVLDLRRFVLSQRLGGVGYYPRSAFVHADTGRVRAWTAE